jgi:hypothetical protein
MAKGWLFVKQRKPLQVVPRDMGFGPAAKTASDPIQEWTCWAPGF